MWNPRGHEKLFETLSNFFSFLKTYIFTDSLRIHNAFYSYILQLLSPCPPRCTHHLLTLPNSVSPFLIFNNQLNSISTVYILLSVEPSMHGSMVNRLRTICLEKTDSPSHRRHQLPTVSYLRERFP